MMRCGVLALVLAATVGCDSGSDGGGQSPLDAGGGQTVSGDGTAGSGESCVDSADCSPELVCVSLL